MSLVALHCRSSSGCPRRPSPSERCALFIIGSSGARGKNCALVQSKKAEKWILLTVFEGE
jgi:hypothetical protein